MSMSGADIRGWRKSVALLVKELALDVVPRTVILAEQSQRRVQSCTAKTHRGKRRLLQVRLGQDEVLAQGLRVEGFRQLLLSDLQAGVAAVLFTRSVVAVGDMGNNSGGWPLVHVRSFRPARVG